MTKRPSPETCTDMTALRALIDAVDDELFDLFAERMACIHRAAEIKSLEGIPADVPWRVTKVVDNARSRAKARGLDPDLYARIWQDIVASSIAAEEERLDKRTT